MKTPGPRGSNEQEAAAGDRAPHAPTGGGAATALAAVLLGGLVCLVYSRAVHAPFVLDDAGSVLQNPSIMRLWPLVGDAERPGPLNPPPFGATSGRPLVNLSLALNYHWNRFEPIGYHVFNVLVHLVSTLLLWAIVRRTLLLPYFGGRFDQAGGPLALAVAILWALHPLTTEAVVYVTQRTELMMACCYLATMYASLRYWSADSRAARSLWLTLAVFASGAGMASKEVMVSAPLVVVLFERTFIAGTLRNCLLRSRPLYVGLASTWLVLLALNYGGPRSDTAGFGVGVPVVAWWCTQAKVLLVYLKLAVWPWPLVIHYEMPYLDSLSQSWMYVLPVAGMFVASLVLVWKRHPAGFVAAAVLFVLAPTLVVPIVTEVAAERRMYLPLAGLVALAVVGGYALLRPSSERGPADVGHPLSMRWRATAACGIFAIVAFAASVVTARRVDAYRDAVTLWQDAVRHQPHNALARQNLGTTLFSLGEVEPAIAELREAVRLRPEFLEAQTTLGLALARIGRSDEAVEHLQLAARLKPDAERIHNNLGVVLFSAGRIDEAIAAFASALAVDPEFADAHANLGRALREAGRLQEAVAEYRRAVELNPNDLNAYVELAAAHEESAEWAEAAAALEGAVQLARTFRFFQLAGELEARLADDRSRSAAAGADATTRPPGD